MKSVCIAVTVALALFLAPQLHACATTGVTDFTTSYRGAPNDDLNDYGRIFEDADDPNCAQNAMYALTSKVRNHLDANSSTFTQWLDGYAVGIIYATALRLGEMGWASKELDQVLDEPLPNGPVALSQRFVHFTGTPPSGACNPETFNTCMDDHAGSALGFAWMAAYKAKRLNHNSSYDVDDKRDEAESHIRQAFASVCIRKTPLLEDRGSTVCDGTVTDLINSDAETLSVNGTMQIIHYGFGLMTSVLSAVQGWEQSGGGTFAFTTGEEAIAKGLYEEIARHADSYGNYPNADCLRLENGEIVGGARCDGVNALGQNPSYLPNMYNLKGPYDHYFPGVIPSSGDYISNSFDPNLFEIAYNSSAGEHFGYARYTHYGQQGGSWIPNNAPDMPDDNYDPVGYFEGISASGLAQGWTCDQDTMDRQARVKVDFYVDGWTLAAEGWAESSSEYAINSICGGNAHRFWVQLPGWTQGKVVRVYGSDFTWYGNTELTCLQSPSCSW